MEHRNRASGWKYAKLSGHSNERLVKQLLKNDVEYRDEFMSYIGYGCEIVREISVGGLHETNVLSVIGKKTKSKTDLKIFCESGKIINISIKKSLGGQVYFVKAGLFIQVFETQFKKHIPEDVKRAISLFWVAADDAEKIIEQYGDHSNAKNYSLQMRHKSLNASTLKAYDEHLYNVLRDWFSDNICELTQLSFSMGAAADSGEWSEFVWYINLLRENDIDEVFKIEDICRAAAVVADQETFYGDKNGGTTIQLPFGFVQWHQAQLQFHHSYAKIATLLGD